MGVTQINGDGVLERCRRSRCSEMARPRRLAASLLTRRAPRNKHRTLFGAATPVNFGHEDPLRPEPVTDPMRRRTSPIITGRALSEKAELFVDMLHLPLRSSKLASESAVSLRRQFTYLTAGHSVQHPDRATEPFGNSSGRKIGEGADRRKAQSSTRRR